MVTATLEGSRIRDWDSFHDECAKEFGFPSFYGRNMNAFVDCLTYLDDGMSRFDLSPEETLEICLTDSDDLRRRCPDIHEAFVHAIGFINARLDDPYPNTRVRLKHK